MKNKKQYYVYLLCNNNNTTLYTGITSNLKKRVWEHKHKVVKGFSQRYNIGKLVYYEIFDDPEMAIVREKQIKAGSREKKIQLIVSLNPEWQDLYDVL